MRKYLLLLAVASLVAAPRAAHAGYTATTGADAVLTPDTNGNFVADVGETFDTVASNEGTFTTYTPDSFPTDPGLFGGDIAAYRYSLDGAASAVAGNVVTYTGLYRIFYDSDLNGAYNTGPDFSVSDGTFNIMATFDVTGTAVLDGYLNETGGPSNPAFRDLGYAGPVHYTGAYHITTPGRAGVIAGTLRAGGAVPEPGTFGLLGTGLLPLLGLRRRR